MTTPRRKRVFFLITLALPLLLLALLEAMLRLSSAFAPEPLFVAADNQPAVYLQVNTRVAQRYFNANQVQVPGAHPDRFLREKAANSLRIFCLGGSTTAGFPFDCQVAFPRQLEYLLRSALPGQRVEIINLGISAINSYSVLDFLPDILDQSPDLLLVYMGHNEFYGALGSASSAGIGGSRWFVRFYQKLQRFHLTQMMRRLINSLRSSGRTPGDRTLMAAMVDNRRIDRDSDLYRQTMDNYRDNLQELLGLAGAKKVKVVLGTVVSNISDFPPFASLHRDVQGRADSMAFHQALHDARVALEAGELLQAGAALDLASQLDSTYAELLYLQGKLLLAAGSAGGARRRLLQARDADGIRFRAGSEVNAIIRDLAGQQALPLAEVEAAFQAASPGAPRGPGLFCDHLHPNPDGYYLIARCFFETMQQAGLLPPAADDFQPPPEPRYVTELDWDIGLLKIFEMIHRWPFPEKNLTFADYPGAGSKLSRETAWNYLFNDNVWSRAHYHMADQYLKEKRFQNAREHYLAVAAYSGTESYPLLQIAKSYEMQEHWDSSAVYLDKALPLSNNKGRILYQTGMAWWKAREFARAVESMQQALYSTDLTPAEKLNTRFYMAGFLRDAGRIKEARSVLQDLLRQNPDFQPARNFLQMLETTLP